MPFKRRFTLNRSYCRSRTTSRSYIKRKISALIAWFFDNSQSITQYTYPKFTYNFDSKLTLSSVRELIGNYNIFGHSRYNPLNCAKIASLSLLPTSTEMNAINYPGTYIWERHRKLALTQKTSWTCWLLQQDEIGGSIAFSVILLGESTPYKFTRNSNLVAYSASPIPAQVLVLSIASLYARVHTVTLIQTAEVKRGTTKMAFWFASPGFRYVYV